MVPAFDHTHCSVHTHEQSYDDNISHQQAVEKAGNRAVPQDIAALAGVDITTARSGLQNLASLTGGDLEVSETGHIVYAFPGNFRLVLRSKSGAVAVRESFEKVLPLCEHLFGYMLALMHVAEQQACS
jgi:hypothetical protein